MNKQLTNYLELKDKILSTTDILKDSFKNAFKTLDKEGFVIIKNNRRKSDSLLIDLEEYNKLLQKIDLLEEEKFEHWAAKKKFNNKEYIKAKDLNI